MGKALSVDLRDRVVAAVEGGLSRRKAAERFGVSISSAIRWTVRSRTSGTVRPRPMGGDQRSGRIEAYAPVILAAVEAKSDITLVELRAMLAQDVRLEVVGIAQDRGAPQVGGYFHRYERLGEWSPAMGLVEGRPAILVSDASGEFFILIDWMDGKVARIRDYRYARYMMTDAQIGAL